MAEMTDMQTTYESSPQATTDKGNFKGILMSLRPKSMLTSPSPSPTAFSLFHGNIPFIPVGPLTKPKELGLPPTVENQKRNMIAKMNLEVKALTDDSPDYSNFNKQAIKDLEKQIQEERISNIEKDMNESKKKERFQNSQQSLRKKLIETNITHTDIAEDINNPRNFDPTQTLSQLIDKVTTKKKQKETTQQQTPPPLDTSDQEESITAEDTAKPLPQKPSTPAAPKSTTSATSISPSKKSQKSKKPKPLWAMSDEQLLAEDTKVEKDVDNLLDFVNDLDFEEYIDDFEVRGALSLIKEKVTDIENNKTAKAEEEANKSSENVAENVAISGTNIYMPQNSPSVKKDVDPIQVKLAQHDEEWNTSTKVERDADGNVIPKKDDTSANLLANTPKKSDAFEKIQKIHSRQSLINVLRQIKKGKDNQREREREKEREFEEMKPEEFENALVNQLQKDPVLIATHDATSGDNFVGTFNAGNTESLKRILVKIRKDPTHVQNLPYLYRCPSI